MIEGFMRETKEVTEIVRSRFADCPLGKELEGIDISDLGEIDDSNWEVFLGREKNGDAPQRLPEYAEKQEILKNKEDGMRREKEVEKELKEKYPPEEGYNVQREVYLRDKDGNIVKDPITGKARRIDIVVTKDGEVVDSVEVTSKDAKKEEQTAKEGRIRDAGGNYVKDENGNLIEIPDSVQTRIERRD